MPYPPNQQVQNVTVFEGGPGYGNPGYLVTQGQYAYDWATALGATFTLENNNTSWTMAMPFQPDNTPTPIPQALQTLLQSNRVGVLAAIQNIAYPPLPANTSYPPFPPPPA